MFRGRIVDNLPPEDVAMLQALYSRSAESVDLHLQKVKEAGSGKFMERFYVGYNHKSIADCGTTTIFFEGVSMLAAKAIQDWPLYSGQETSTRYIDMAKQPLIDPLGTEQSAEVHATLMRFYTRNQDRVANEVRRRHPKGETEDQATYDRAVKARTFDIMRGFLPAGVTTQLSWHTNLRQAGDHLAGMLHHPLKEVRDIATITTASMGDMYPSTAGIGKQAAVSAMTGGEGERANWERGAAALSTYDLSTHTCLRSFRSSLDRELLLMHRELLASRPRGSVLPHFLTDVGQLRFRFMLDFGSFRDIQRHRNGACRMPLLRTTGGFHPWYIEQLDEELAVEAKLLLDDAARVIGTMTDDEFARQYYIPMGYQVPCAVTYGLPAALYVIELRSSKTVHPTLRKVAHWMYNRVSTNYPEVAIHADLSPDDWTVRRGNQTIEART